MESSRVTAYLEGRISSANAEETQRELLQVMEENPERELEIDAGGLEYISSAGLRVLMMLARKQGNALTVRNVSPEVYDILEMTGFTSILNVKKKLREFSVDGCEVVGRGAIGTVYRIDEDTIIKVYELPDSIPMIENEQKRAKQAFLKGIPTAISYDVVKVGDKYGSVFELLRASTYNDLIRDATRRSGKMRLFGAMRISCVKFMPWKWIAVSCRRQRRYFSAIWTPWVKFCRRISVSACARYWKRCRKICTPSTGTYK